MAERFRLLVVAAKEGFYGDRLHYPKESGHKRAGFSFAILADALKYDENGKMLVNKNYEPILPSWVIPQGPIPKIDPKTTECRVVEVAPKKFGKGRKVPKEVLEAAPKSWPANSKKRSGMEMDENREVKIKRAGTGIMAGAPDLDEDDGE